MKSHIIRLCLLTLLSLSLLLQTAWARTWHVTRDRPTIQVAIDFAVDGDSILVAPGTYYEALLIQGRNIVLKSEAGADATIIDASWQDVPASVIFCRDGITNDTVIEGFTITGGRGTNLAGSAYTYPGGGLLCVNAAPIIRGNRIIGNRAEDIPPNVFGSSRGGGILFGSSDHSLPPILIEHNAIIDNFAIANGGGIEIAGPCIIRHNLIQGNRTGHGDGGGFYYLGGEQSPIIIQENVIVGNIAADRGGAMNIAITSPYASPASEFQIIGNVMVGNESNRQYTDECSGGAVAIYGGAIITGNTIAFNSVGTAFAEQAGGICLYRPTAGTVVERNIIQGNHAVGVVVQLPVASWAVTLRHNLLHQNEMGNVLAPADAIQRIENLFADAFFCMEGPQSRGDLAGLSPALAQSYGVIGAVAQPGCSPYVPVSPTTWGQLKARYR